MNILFIEDEKELASVGILQLEARGYTVFLARDIAEAREVLADTAKKVHFIITDHRLPDGRGIDLLVELKQSDPRCKCGVVSGCLTDADTDLLERSDIPYFHKPLLYGKVIDELRRIQASKAAKSAKVAAPKPDPSGAPEATEGKAPPSGRIPGQMPSAPNGKKSRGLRKFLPFKRPE